MIGFLARLFGGGLLDRVLDTVDRRVAADADKERVKADLIAEHMRTRPDFMRAGGFWLMALFAVPLAVWFGAVCLYSLLWCRLCAFPQTWSIAALPPPLDQWSGLMVTSLFGVVGLANFRR
jgi:hypothetical protein